MQNSEPQFTNALIHESSPYLLQHAHNPVHWFPWGTEALEKAKKEDKPLLISIGYAACHWCHVMERESYSDPQIAQYMNEHFVAIKIDREERPDIDQIYMDAALLLNGGGGWPLNAFALPDGKPFYALTYLPPDRWLGILERVVEIYTKQKAQVEDQAQELTDGIVSQNLIPAPENKEETNWKNFYTQLFEPVKKFIDYQNGGVGHSPKFAMPSAWEWLLQFHSLTGNEDALKAVTTTLEKMAFGGIYDQIGGGFARYATDSEWIVPHFEKMLYDNAQLVSLYAQAFRLTKNPLYEEVVRETLGFIQRELTDPSGGFYSSLNADSEGVEGKFYVWKRGELASYLSPKEFSLLTEFCYIKKDGNWEEGNNILYHTEGHEAFASRHFLSLREWMEIWNNIKGKLMYRRSERVRPTTDNKILTSWNALALKAFTEAYKTWGDPGFLEAALKNAAFISENMIQADGSILRNYMNGKTSITGLLDDYAYTADAFVALYSVTFDVEWLKKADRLVTYALEHFSDPENPIFFYTSNLGEKLITRKKEIQDSVLPASNSILAQALYDLGSYFDKPEYLDRAQAMLHTVKKAAKSSPIYFAQWLKLTAHLGYGTKEVAVTGADAVEKSLEIQKNYNPLALFLGGTQENLPLLEGKLQEETTFYVCEDKVCKTPVHFVQGAIELLKR